VYRGIITGYINGQKQQPRVFNGQCNFGYKISSWIERSIPQIELIHSLNSFSYIRIPFLPFIFKTIMISKKRIDDHALLYQQIKIPDYYLQRIIYIQNAIVLPGVNAIEKDDQAFTVLYAGRATADKRVHLVAQIAEKLKNLNYPIQFEILGDVSEAIDPNKFPYIRFRGNQNNAELINTIYSAAHILLLTSSTEGFPMVIMEAMANGCAIIATPVGDIPLHVKNNLNGFLFSSVENEIKIMEEGIEFIQNLFHDKKLFETISKNNTNYAKHNFGIERFNKQYQDLLEYKPVEAT
jgi:glycosyltransferase involved in cell wall biosynthesis